MFDGNGKCEINGDTYDYEIAITDEAWFELYITLSSGRIVTYHTNIIDHETLNLVVASDGSDTEIYEIHRVR